MRPEVEQRFWSKVEKTDTCWIWHGARHRLYGRFKHENGQSARAHRVAWELTHGAIPKNMKVLHRCDNPPCVNPAHLSLGSQKDNVLDAITKGRHVIFGRPPAPAA